MIELTGMFGRLPVLLTHVNVLQKVVHVNWNTCPGVFFVFSSKPPTAA